MQKRIFFNYRAIKCILFALGRQKNIFYTSGSWSVFYCSLRGEKIHFSTSQYRKNRVQHGNNIYFPVLQYTINFSSIFQQWGIFLAAVSEHDEVDSNDEWSLSSPFPKLWLKIFIILKRTLEKTRTLFLIMWLAWYTTLNAGTKFKHYTLQFLWLVSKTDNKNRFYVSDKIEIKDVDISGREQYIVQLGKKSLLCECQVWCPSKARSTFIRVK